MRKHSTRRVKTEILTFHFDEMEDVSWHRSVFQACLTFAGNNTAFPPDLGSFHDGFCKMQDIRLTVQTQQMHFTFV